jgi:RNA polymerase primary sigma factor
MRLINDYTASADANGSATLSAGNARNKPIPPTKDADNPENRNLTLARLVEEQKLKLIETAASFPVTALWVLNKYEQSLNKDEQEDESVLAAEYRDLLKTIKKHYQSVSRFSEAGKAKADSESGAQKRLKYAVQQFPYTFDDLVKLVDIIAYAFKHRGLVVKPESVANKKHWEVINNRLSSPSRPGRFCTPQQYTAMGLQKYEEQFLFLDSGEMVKLLPELILAEHYWLFYRQQLATANAKLVLFIANQYKGNFLDFEDLVQEGQTGLLKAVDRFKYRMGFQFSTYAGYWIRQAISRALSRSERVVRIPCGQVAMINKVFRTKEELTLKWGKEPSIDELSKYASLSREEVVNILSIAQTAVPLESFDDDEEEQAFAPIDYLDQKVFTPAYDKIAKLQLEKMIKTAVKTLNAREMKIICAHFGIDTGKQMTLQEIGAELNLTRERVRQIQAVALAKMKMRYGDQLLSML